MRYYFEELINYQYPSHIRFCHDMKFYQDYLWLYMWGSLDTERILKINPDDLSDYTEISCPGSGKSVTRLLIAKGYIWFPYEFKTMKLVRLDPITHDIRIYSGIDVEQMTKPQVLLYVEEKDEIWMSAYEGYRIIDVSGDLSHPNWEPSNYRNIITFPDPPKLYNLHTGLYDNGYVYFFGIDRNNEIFKTVGVMKINVQDPLSYSTNGFHEEIGHRYVTDECMLRNNKIYIGLEQVDPHHATEHIAVIDSANLDCLMTISANGIPENISCYGTFPVEDLIIALFPDSPGVLKIYDLNLNELYNHIFPTSYNKVNEFLYINDRNNFVTFWENSNLKIFKLEFKKSMKNLIDGFDTTPLQGGLIT